MHREELHGGNIIVFLLKHTYNLKCYYEQLKRIKEIGDKIASFLLRNIILTNKIDIKENDQHYLLPIDTWIDQICVYSKYEKK